MDLSPSKPPSQPYATALFLIGEKDFETYDLQQAESWLSSAPGTPSFPGECTDSGRTLGRTGAEAIIWSLTSGYLTMQRRYPARNAGDGIVLFPDHLEK